MSERVKRCGVEFEEGLPCTEPPSHPAGQHVHRCGEGGCNVSPGEIINPCPDPYETLALIAEHRLTVRPDQTLGGWRASSEGSRHGNGPTIADAVRAVVERIREAGRG